MFYRVESTICTDRELLAKVVLSEKGVGYTEIVKTIQFTIPIEKDKRVFADEVNALVELALKNAGFSVTGHEYAEPSPQQPSGLASLAPISSEPSRINPV